MLSSSLSILGLTITQGVMMMKKSIIIPTVFLGMIGGYVLAQSEIFSSAEKASTITAAQAKEAALKAFTDAVADELVKGGKVQLVGFGTFEVSERAAREGRNPQSGEVMKIAASKAPKFKAGKALKDMVNK